MPRTGARLSTEDYPSPHRPRNRRDPRPKALTFVLALGIVLLAAAAARYFLARPVDPTRRALEGYIADPATLANEYAKFKGKPPTDPQLAAQFNRAAALAAQADYDGALTELEGLSKEADLPVVFNDLGVLYAALNDRARAINAFREALARDIDYAPVRSNLDRVRAGRNSADPVSAEVEPNNTDQLANLIGLNKPIDGEITAASGDEDCFRFITPPAPRDRLEISLANHSQTLEPRVRLYDNESVILPWEESVRRPGAPLSLIIAPRPNVPLYLHVFGEDGTGGAYTLLVKPLKAFDRYEPDDDIFSARKIALGQQIDANIMDADDTDFYSFVAGKTGNLAIDIQNQSATLVPALTTFSSDMRTTGFAPQVRKPGGSLHHTIPVEDGHIYYIQVWSEAKSSGDYALTVSAQ